MDVRQLSTLVAVADHGTFSAAARALFTVQSNVSAHIARLEKELGVSLVDRQHGKLTDEGARVVERARRVLNEVDDIVADVASRDADISGQTRLGVIGTTARWLVPQMLGRLGTEHPGVRTVIQEGATSTLIPNVLSGHLNAALVHLPIDDPELVIEPLFAEDLFLLASSSHPLAAHETIPLRDLDQRSARCSNALRRRRTSPCAPRRKSTACVFWLRLPSTASVLPSFPRRRCPIGSPERFE